MESDIAVQPSTLWASDVQRHPASVSVSLVAAAILQALLIRDEPVSLSSQGLSETRSVTRLCEGHHNFEIVIEL